MRVFQKVATAIFIAFMVVLIGTVMIAFSRRSSSTGLDMAKVQKMRYTTSTYSNE